MPKKSRVFLSNSAVFLLAKLAENLFSKQQTPTTQRWILVPNSNISYWVKKELTKATSNHIFMGSRIFSSSDALIKHILKEVCVLNPEMPDYITLPLFIHEILKSSLSCSDNQKQFSHQPAYTTSKQLAAIFKNVYVFSQLPEKNKYPYQEKIFSQLNDLFHPLDSIFQSILTTIKTKQVNIFLHIFGSSHLPYHIASFFENLSEFINISFYALTPSKEFFSDIRSDRVIDSFYKNNLGTSSDIYQQYISPERHTLLTNLSHKMQMFQNFCIDNNLDCIEVFKNPEPPPSSSLQYIQHALYHVEPILPQEVIAKKETVYINKSYHESREVHEIFTKISYLLKQGVNPEEIFILSPNIDAYTHYLNAIFSPHIPIYFLNQETDQVIILKEKILLLLALVQTKGNIYRLLQVLSHPDLIKPINKQMLPSLTKALLDEWKKITHSDQPVIHQLIHNIMNQHPFINSKDSINLFELWENVLPVLEDLNDFVSKTSLSEERTYNQYFEYLYLVLAKIFQISPQEEEYLTLFQHLISQKVHTFTCSLPFFVDFLLDFLSTFRNSTPLYQPGPYVGTLNDCSFLPKGYTFIIGACETNNFDPDSLDLQSIKEKDKTTSPEDEENFHFLQTLLSTQHELYISYVSSKHKPFKPKYFLQNLLDITGLQVQSLDTPIYHPETFATPISLHESQAHYYQIAKACCEKKYSLLSCFITPATTPIQLPSHCSIQTLVNTLLYPFEQFLVTHYGKIYAPKHTKLHTQIFPNEKFIRKLWEFHLFNEDLCDQLNYTSRFSQKICLNYDQALKKFFSQHNTNQSVPPVICLSKHIFHKLNEKRQRIVPPLELHVNNQKILIQGRIGAVYQDGLYINQIAPSQIFAKVKKFTSTQLKNLLEGYISLAVLQLTDVLPTPKLNAITVQTQNKHAVTLAVEPLSIPFDDPEKYLHLVMKLTASFLQKPMPITYSNWQELTKPTEKFYDHLLKKQCETNDSDCFFFYHREHSEYTPLTKEELDLIQTIFPKPKSTRKK